MNIRKNDVVKVISGSSRGKEGKVIRTITSKSKILVQGVNIIWKHMKRSQQHPHGARIQKESPINVSNVLLVCTSCNKPTRVNYKTTSGGDKNRICKKCKQVITES
ncbi:MAG: 50S ribosomal protein L24 [Planctomycetes bacterium]|nr:50S ribosomal protein L24 [Planctomycetota bacterium]